MVALHEQAVQFALDTYNGREDLRDSTVEFGGVLYANDAGELLSVDLVMSQRSDEVALYDTNVLVRVLDSLEKEPRYIGDYHTHPRRKAWMSQFPSPSDVASVSVVNDLWPNERGLVLPAAPKVQIVQSLLFGDVFVLLPVAERPRFTTLKEQAKELHAIEAAFTAAHRKSNDIHGEIPENPLSAQFDRVADEVTTRLNDALKGRATLTLTRNAKGASRSAG